ncbi:MAG: hypothetical protein IH892_07805 [Planctomycetes bacterium]|nr:hypothetical protein [Planctomycetota bacterium]
MSYIEFLRRACCIFAVIVCSQFAASALAQETVPLEPTRRTLPPTIRPAGTPLLGIDQPVGTPNSTEATPQLRPRTILATPADPVSNQSRSYSVGKRNAQHLYQQARQFGAPATTTRRESQVMVIPTREVRSDQFAATSEDLRVMLHILKQETAADRPDRGGVVFSDFGDFFKAQRPSFEALYLQGHGVLFFLEAEFDMASLPEPDQAPPSADATHVDPVWQSARRAMLTPKGSAAQPVPPRTQLSADELAARIIPTLKHAANIRFLRPPETITIRVLKKDRAMTARGFAMYGGGGTMMIDEQYGGGYGGGGGGYGAAGAGALGGGYGGGFGGGAAGVVSPMGRDVTAPDSQAPQWDRSNRRGPSAGDRIVGVRTLPPPAANTLTLHVLKSDVDDFAQGKIPLAEFKRRVKVLKY